MRAFKPFKFCANAMVLFVISLGLFHAGCSKSAMSSTIKKSSCFVSSLGFIVIACGYRTISAACHNARTFDVCKRVLCFCTHYVSRNRDKRKKKRKNDYGDRKTLGL